jgi:hypothetical protein
MLIGIIVLLILIVLVGGRATKDLLKGLLSLCFGAILLMAGCAIV